MTADGAAKLDRLRRDLRRNRAALRAMQAEARQLADAARDGKRIATENMRTTSKWSDRQPLIDLMRLPAEELASLQVNVSIAAQSLAMSREAAALTSDIDVLNAETTALAQLVARCEQYLKDGTQ